MSQAWPYVRPRCRSVPVFRATCRIPGSRGPIPPTNSQQNDQEARLPSGNRAPDLHFLVAGRDMNPRLLGYEPSVTPHNPVRQPGHQSPSPCSLPLPRRQLRTQRAECLSTPTDLASSPEFNFTRPPTAVRSCRHVAGHPAHPGPPLQHGISALQPTAHVQHPRPVGLARLTSRASPCGSVSSTDVQNDGQMTVR
jgi:hypothetical protein